MASKRPLSLLSLPAPLRTSTCLQCQIRSLHKLNTPSRIPKPTPFVPDATTFLTLIGRKMSSHASKIPTWEALFTLSSAQLREAGIEPARARRYLLWWRERFRNGLYGIGGDLKKVKEGIAQLQVVEVPLPQGNNAAATLSRDAGTRKMVINVEPTAAMPPDPANPDKERELRARAGGIMAALAPAPIVSAKDAEPVKGMKIVQGSIVGGTGVEYIKGFQGVARLRVQEGLWEQRRGHKVDGGERRRAEVRAKRRAAERKNAR